MFLFVGVLHAQNSVPTDTVGVKVYFRRGYSTFDTSYRDNGKHLESFVDRVNTLRQNPSCRIRSIRFTTGASPEGSAALNERLSQKRAEFVRQYLESHLSLGEIPFECISLGIDWDGLTQLVEDSEMPYRDEVLDILHNTPVWVIRDGRVVDGRTRQLGMLRGGAAWRYMEEHFYPELRSMYGMLLCEFEQPEVVEPEKPVEPVTEEPAEPAEEPEESVETVEPVETVDSSAVSTPVSVVEPADTQKPFYMALKSNLLYDVALVPNLGIEFYLGRGWSLGGNWMYAWWSSDARHNYWRTYGGELDLRKYFGRRAAEKPLTGHHLGIYGQMLTYDFETGGTGYQSKLSYGVGIEYGYSLPIGRRLNLDFGIGIGYLGGEYKKYRPIDSHYVWQETKQRHWFGPTKAEISLVWLIGRGNYNAK